MTSSLITVIVAISPTLGQSFRTFVLQLTGTGASQLLALRSGTEQLVPGLGSLYGLIILEIFKNVGGYAYNPCDTLAFIAPAAD